jgi:hypothetical protein
MVVRIQLRTGRPVARKLGKNRHVAYAMAALLKPPALMAYVFVAWRLGSDMGMVGEFPLGGIWSHWQVWLVLGVFTHIAAWTLNKYGSGGKLGWPSALTPRILSPRQAEAEKTVRVRRATAGR